MGKEFTAEEMRIRDIIIEWAKEKAEQGEIEFNKGYTGEVHICYRTNKIKELMQEKSAENYNRNRFRIIYWNKPEPPYHYVYEIGVDSKENKLYLQLVFNFDSISDITKGICEQIYNNFRDYPRKDDLKKSYRRVRYYKTSIEINEKKESIMLKLDQLFDQMKGYEAFIINKLKDTDQASPQ